jgi:hypothetical protein
MIWVGHVAQMGEMRSTYIFLVGMCEGKRSGDRQRGKDNIKMDVKSCVKDSSP